ncbi:hypothetical protein B0H13DRAFT_1887860 [Mycena leptocephala]|nr:hypothetical protein B0H13DRAFT_1887860 [Mycena leptocephala]
MSESNQEAQSPGTSCLKCMLGRNSATGRLTGRGVSEPASDAEVMQIQVFVGLYHSAKSGSSVPVPMPVLLDFKSEQGHSLLYRFGALYTGNSGFYYDSLRCDAYVINALEYFVYILRITLSLYHFQFGFAYLASAGQLVTSATLLLVSLQYLDFRKTQMLVENMEIDGTGILHIIWLYRNHQGLQSALDQVGSPTNQKLQEGWQERVMVPETNILNAELLVSSS